MHFVRRIFETASHTHGARERRIGRSVEPCPHLGPVMHGHVERNRKPPPWAERATKDELAWIPHLEKIDRIVRENSARDCALAAFRARDCSRAIDDGEIEIAKRV